ncbi:hypothetical protein [Nonomuraea sp. NPDC050643]
MTFSALMYDAALQPEEAINLRDIALPPLALGERTGQLTEATKDGENCA